MPFSSNRRSVTIVTHRKFLHLVSRFGLAAATLPWFGGKRFLELFPSPQSCDASSCASRQAKRTMLLKPSLTHPVWEGDARLILSDLRTLHRQIPDGFQRQISAGCDGNVASMDLQGPVRSDGQAPCRLDRPRLSGHELKHRACIGDQRLARLNDGIFPDSQPKRETVPGTVSLFEGIAIQSSKGIAVTAGTGVAIQSKASTSIKAGTTATIEASGTTDLKGAVVKLNGGTKPVATVGGAVGNGKVMTGSVTILGNEERSAHRSACGTRIKRDDLASTIVFT